MVAATDRSLSRGAKVGGGVDRGNTPTGLPEHHPPSRRRNSVARRPAIFGQVALAACLLAAAAGCTGSSRPITPSSVPSMTMLSDPSLTPPGWTAVRYRDAQVSVPSSWVVQPPAGGICGVTTHGALLMGHSLAALKASGCRRGFPATIVLMTPAAPRPSNGSLQRLNGLTVILVNSGFGSISYSVPALHVEVTAVGPQARQVIDTVTRSPLSVTLDGGPPYAVPHSWRWLHFGGVRFAAPGSWTLSRATTWGNCVGKLVFANTVHLSTAARSGCRCCMSSAAPLAGSWTQLPGVSVGDGPAAVDQGPGTQCLRLHGLRACIPAYSASGSYGNPLALEVYVPGRARPTTFEIGLAGTGAVPRTVLDSIQPARA